MGRRLSSGWNFDGVEARAEEDLGGDSSKSAHRIGEGHRPGNGVVVNDHDAGGV